MSTAETPRSIDTTQMADPERQTAGGEGALALHDVA